MKILARGHGRVIVHVAGNIVALVELNEDVELRDGQLWGPHRFEQTAALDCDVDAITIHTCEGCRQSYGPRGAPPGGSSMFQQFALVEGSYPWNSTRGWYCMGCSMPPR